MAATRDGGDQQPGTRAAQFTPMPQQRQQQPQQQQKQAHAMYIKGGNNIDEKGRRGASGDFMRLEDGSDRETDATKETISHDEKSQEYLTGLRLLFLMSGLTLVMLLGMLDISIIATAIPQITSDFHRLEHVGWYIGAYQLSSAALQPLTGKIFTYFNTKTKWSYLVFFFVFELGSVLSGAATSSVMLIVGRAVAGLGNSGLTNGTLTIIASAIRPSRRPLHTAVAMGVSQVGIVVGPVLGGVFTEFVSWRWCFYINLPLGAVTAVCLVLTDIPDQVSKEPMSIDLLHKLLPRLDLVGFSLFAPAAIMALLALQFGASTSGWSSSIVIGLFCGAAAVAGIFLAWECRMGDDAMIPFGMMRKQIVWASSLSFSFAMSVTIVAANFLPIYFQSVRGLSPAMSGLYMLVATGTQILSILISGALMTRLGYYMPWAIAAGVLSAISTGLMSTWGPVTSLAAIFGYQILYGARGVGIQVPVVAIQQVLQPKEVAIGSSLMVFFSNFNTAVLVTVGNAIFQESLVQELAEHAPVVSAEAAVAAGGSAEAVRALVTATGAELEGLLLAYSLSFNKVIYLLIVLSMLVLVSAFGLGWVDLRAASDERSQDNV